ncbi:MAG: hypothetical protein II184_06760, partial [Clostridia bacterium]|nr:hypothetical protein [Clostridia bacterium]
PPLETQDFVLGSGPAAVAPAPATTTLYGSEVKLPHGLTGYSNLEDGIAAAAEQGKKVFVDITGHGCVNCREMEGYSRTGRGRIKILSASSGIKKTASARICVSRR